MGRCAPRPPALPLAPFPRPGAGAWVRFIFGAAKLFIFIFFFPARERLARGGSTATKRPREMGSVGGLLLSSAGLPGAPQDPPRQRRDPACAQAGAVVCRGEQGARRRRGRRTPVATHGGHGDIYRLLCEGRRRGPPGSLRLRALAPPNLGKGGALRQNPVSCRAPPSVGCCARPLSSLVAGGHGVCSSPSLSRGAATCLGHFEQADITGSHARLSYAGEGGVICTQLLW